MIKPYNELKNKFHICKIFKKSEIISYKYTHEQLIDLAKKMNFMRI